MVVLLLSVQWIRVTMQPTELRLRSTHTVKLTWKASRSQVAGYNLYRRTSPEFNYVRINSSPVRGSRLPTIPSRAAKPTTM